MLPVRGGDNPELMQARQGCHEEKIAKLSMCSDGQGYEHGVDKGGKESCKMSFTHTTKQKDLEVGTYNEGHA